MKVLTGITIGITLALIYLWLPAELRELPLSSALNQAATIAVIEQPAEQTEANIKIAIDHFPGVVEAITEEAAQVPEADPMGPVAEAEVVVENNLFASDETLPFQPAWTPFRSERSATGFAEKLSAQLQQEFRVVRQGPGKYLVGFDASLEDKDNIMQGIESLTGYNLDYNTGRQ